MSVERTTKFPGQGGRGDGEQGSPFSICHGLTSQDCWGSEGGLKSPAQIRLVAKGTKVLGE